MIGVTTPELTRHKTYQQSIQPLRIRKRAVAAFCDTLDVPYSLVDLSDPYGPTITRESGIQALSVTTETEAGASKINEIRAAAGLLELPIYICKLLPDETGRELHSEAIRAGTTNRNGLVYLSHFSNDLVLNDSQRSFFSKPLGTVIDDSFEAPNSENPICVVGDISIEKFEQLGWKYHLAIFDKKSQREEYSSHVIDSLEPNFTITNPAGVISVELFRGLRQALDDENKCVFVEGEEDLATVALVMLLPLGATIFYGQPHDGMVYVEVTEELKEKVFQLLKQPT